MEEKGRSSFDGSDISMADLLREGWAASEKLLNHEVVRVQVVEVIGDQVLVNIGEKKEGVIPVSEFGPDSVPGAGAEIPAVLEKKAQGDRPALLSHRRALHILCWADMEKAFGEKRRVKGRISRQVNGGYLVDLGGVLGFLPLSLSDIRQVYRPHLPVGAAVRCYILEMTQQGTGGPRILLSRRQVLEEERKERRRKALERIKLGGVYRGVVSQVKEFGAFVDLGGVEGLVPVADAAWRDPQKALKSFKRGQRVRVKVLRLDLISGRIGLGIKQLLPNPLDELRRRFPAKTAVKAKVESVEDAGVRVSLGTERDISGWIASEELGTMGSPAVGEECSAVVLGVRAESFDLNLSIKRREEIEDKKRIQQYLKGAPPLTLGQLFKDEE